MQAEHKFALAVIFIPIFAVLVVKTGTATNQQKRKEDGYVGRGN